MAVKTQAQALDALVFLYRIILLRPLQLEMHHAQPATAQAANRPDPRRGPRLLLAMPVHLRLLAQLMYGSDFG